MASQPNKGTCPHPNCQKPGQVRVFGNSGFWCFEHKPIGRIVK